MIELIPAIDIIDGKCVRLSQGDYASRKVYNENPLEVACMLEDGGIRRLHLVDLDGAASHHIVNYKVLEQIATRTSLVVDFGGGLKTDEDLRIAFENGAQMVTGGSVAVKSPDVFARWIVTYGAERIILGGDIPSPANPPKGCKFHTRCSQCMDVCKFKTPQYIEHSKNHFVACHLYDNEVMSNLDKYNKEYKEMLLEEEQKALQNEKKQG